MIIFLEKESWIGSYGRHGSLPPQISIIKVRYKKLRGKPPVPPIASDLLYTLL